MRASTRWKAVNVGTVLAGRTDADDDHVVVVYCGSSPDCSRTMYSAYQSGQFASCCPAALLVLAVGGLRTPKRAGQVACGAERSRGVADVMFVPNWTEHPEPGGVNWTTRKPLSKWKSASSRHPSLP